MNDDENALAEAMASYVMRNLQRCEMMDFLKRDFPQYKWSLRTLDRRLRKYGLHYNPKDVSIDAVREAVKHELEGPGQLLGYRAMHKKIRQEYGLLVSRDAVYDIMSELDSAGLAKRGGVGLKKQPKRKTNFSSLGPNWMYSLDGHDKLMGYQNSTFPLAIYGCIDTFSRKLLWLKIWTSNSDPKVVGRWYLEFLMESSILPCNIRMDKGTETGTVATLQAFLKRFHCQEEDKPEDSVLFGPSTSNQIERWWKELHERLEKFYKQQLAFLKDAGHYDPHDQNDRMIIAFLFIPILQRELDIFKDSVWNSHRIRAQKDTLLPDGIPDHTFAFPETYGASDCGLPLTEEQLKEAAELSGLLNVEDDYLTAEFREKCEAVIPDPSVIESIYCTDFYIELKKRLA